MSEFLTPEIITILVTIVSFIIGLVAKEPKYQKFKQKTSQAKSILTEVDDALYDDKITEEEFRNIFDKLKRSYDNNS